MLTFSALILFVVCAFGIATVRLRWAGVPPWRRSRTVPRRRRHVGRRAYALALRFGFRYSYARDALVLRLVGRRWGPVLKLATPTGTAASPAAAPAGVFSLTAAAAAYAPDAPAPMPDGVRDLQGAAGSAPAAHGSATDVPRVATGTPTFAAGVQAFDASAPPSAERALQPPSDAPSPADELPDGDTAAAAGPDLTAPRTLGLERSSAPAKRVVDVACLPLPHVHRTQRLWQLTAVDVEVRFVWVELKRTRGEPPPPQDAAGFIRRIAADLDALGLRLDAIVVRSEGAPRRPIFDAAVTGGIRLLRVPPGARHERIASHTHDRIVATYWRKTFAEDPGRSIGALRRGLRSWVDAHNAAPPPHDAAALAPTAALAPAAALRAQANPPLVVPRRPAPGHDEED
jgi:hypothetical protein